MPASVAKGIMRSGTVHTRFITICARDLRADPGIQVHSREEQYCESPRVEGCTTPRRLQCARYYAMVIHL
jgi:hypothetical protein